MTLLSPDRLMPDIIPAKNAGQIVWNGPLEHIGPVPEMTPLKQAMMGKTCCGLYLLYIGCIGFLTRRLAPVMNINLNRCLCEQIFAYQFDWRYAKPYGITLIDIEANPDKIAAIRRTIPYFFFTSIERTSGFFLSTAPVDEMAHIVNLTRHLCGAENKGVVDGWVEQMLVRLEDIAPCEEFDTPVLDDFDARADWEAAVRLIHGQPLPLELLDLRTDPSTLDLDGLAALRLESLVAADNPLLRPAAEVLALGMVGSPYRIRG